MIFGTGIDIIDVARIGHVHSRWGDKFLNKFLRPDEIEYCLQQAIPLPVSPRALLARRRSARRLAPVLARS